MLERRKVAPFCLVTGVSCALAPPTEILKEDSPLTSFHHAEHSEARLLKMKVLGRTIRTSRLQLTLNTYHNKGPKAYHRFYQESYDPVTRIGRCGKVLFNVARAIPDEVVDTQAGCIRPIEEDERQRLFTSNEIRMQSEFTIRRFFTAMTLDMVENHTPQASLRAYKRLKAGEREPAGNEIIGKLLPFAFKELEGAYAQAKDRGILAESAPNNASEVARQFIFQEPDRFKMLDDVAFNDGRKLWLPVNVNGQPINDAA